MNTKAAIVYLVHKKERGKIESLRNSLTDLDRFFQSQAPLSRSNFS